MPNHDKLTRDDIGAFAVFLIAILMLLFLMP
jgi:hypothetical protein